MTCGTAMALTVPMIANVASMSTIVNPAALVSLEIELVIRVK